MRKSLASMALILSLVLVLAGCGKTKYEPVAIDESVDKCPVCNMAVADDSFATEIILKNKKALKFDDLGDLFVWKAKNGESDIGEQFVRDYNTREWLKLSDATYVYDKSTRTPMAYNVISFKDKADAEAFVQKEGAGEILTADQLADRKWEPNEEMMKQMMGDSGDMHMESDPSGDMKMDGGAAPSAEASSASN